MELSLSEAEVRLVERLLNEHQSGLPTDGSGEERELVATLLHKLSHPMRGVIEQDDSALLTDVGESIPR
jgi:hypothetical protein